MGGLYQIFSCLSKVGPVWDTAGCERAALDGGSRFAAIVGGAGGDAARLGTPLRAARPERTPGGFRLYSRADERRIRSMQAHMAAASRRRGRRLAVAESAASVVPPAAPRRSSTPLVAAAEAFDATRFDALLDAAFALGQLTAIRDVVLPVLVEVGDALGAREITVGHEHFASHLIERRLLSLAQGWEAGRGRCAARLSVGRAPHARLVCFGLVLADRGWRIAYLGADTPSIRCRRERVDGGRRRRPLRPATPSLLAGADEIAELARAVARSSPGDGASARACIAPGGLLRRGRPRGHGAAARRAPGASVGGRLAVAGIARRATSLQARPLVLSTGSRMARPRRRRRFAQAAAPPCAARPSRARPRRPSAAAGAARGRSPAPPRGTRPCAARRAARRRHALPGAPSRRAGASCAASGVELMDLDVLQREDRLAACVPTDGSGVTSTSTRLPDTTRSGEREGDDLGNALSVADRRSRRRECDRRRRQPM